MLKGKQLFEEFQPSADKLFLGNAQDTVSVLVIKLRTMSMDQQSRQVLQNNS